MAATQGKIICRGICERSIVTLLSRGGKRQVRGSINEIEERKIERQLVLLLSLMTSDAQGSVGLIHQV